MANSLLTINMITREAVRVFKNSNAFIQSINTQYDDQFAIEGAKIGTTLRIRLPNDYTVSNGPALQIQDTAEQQTTLTVSTQATIGVSFNTQERTMSLDDYSERVLLPMMNNMAGNIALNVAQGADTGGVCNYVQNVDGSNNVLSPTQTEFLSAKAVLLANSAPGPRFTMANDPFEDARAVTSLTGLLNPSTEISEQYRSGMMKNGLGFDWITDQTIVTHTSGSFSAGTVNQAGQTGNTLIVNAITGTLNAGDIITIDSVYAVNRVTKASTGQLRQFVITAAAASGATQLSIYPAIVPAVNGQQQQYQTVTVSPANAAPITLVQKASTTIRRGIGFYKDAVTLVTADLVMPKKVEEAARAVYDGISMRMVTDYIIGTDQLATRCDVLYGYKYVRPEWAVFVADKL